MLNCVLFIFNSVYLLYVMVTNLQYLILFVDHYFVHLDLDKIGVQDNVIDVGDTFNH